MQKVDPQIMEQFVDHAPNQVRPPTRWHHHTCACAVVYVCTIACADDVIWPLPGGGCHADDNLEHGRSVAAAALHSDCVYSRRVTGPADVQRAHDRWALDPAAALRM